MEINMVSLRKRKKAVSAGPQETRDRVVNRTSQATDLSKQWEASGRL